MHVWYIIISCMHMMRSAFVTTIYRTHVSNLGVVVKSNRGYNKSFTTYFFPAHILNCGKMSHTHSVYDSLSSCLLIVCGPLLRNLLHISSYSKVTVAYSQSPASMKHSSSVGCNVDMLGLSENRGPPHKQERKYGLSAVSYIVKGPWFFCSILYFFMFL